MPTTFSDLNLNKPLLNALDDMGFRHPTPIQEKGFSVAMSGRNMVGIAQTGTGKTLAYLLPCLRLWTFSKEKHPQILIIVPTRELVVQIVEEAEKLTAYMDVVVRGVYGGANINTQKLALMDGLDVLVATPGRLLDLVLHGAVKLHGLKRVVIDEIDEMLGLGFRPQLVRVIDLLPKKKQVLMFSATMSDEVDSLIEEFFETPVIVEAARAGTPLDNIEQTGFEVPNFHTKANFLEQLLADEATFSKVLVFLSTKRLTDLLYGRLAPKFGDALGLIHSDKSQNNRFATVQAFERGDIRILIATDIIARGIDIAEVSHVINFDLPEEAEHYIHRIGRTGRADKRGNAIALVTEAELDFKEAIEALMEQPLHLAPLPDGIEVSEVLIEEEKPKIFMKAPPFKMPKKTAENAAFHEKLEKNKKVNRHLTRAMQMREKYKKPKTRGQKKRGKG